MMQPWKKWRQRTELMCSEYFTAEKEYEVEKEKERRRRPKWQQLNAFPRATVDGEEEDHS
jgi:predicted nucleic acid-binding protein